MSHLRPLAPRATTQSQSSTHILRQRRYRHLDTEWENRKPFIIQLYVTDNRNAEDVCKILENHGFLTSRRQLFHKLKAWGIRKKKKWEKKRQHDQYSARPIRERDGREEDTSLAKPTAEDALAWLDNADLTLNSGNLGPINAVPALELDNSRGIRDPLWLALITSELQWAPDGHPWGGWWDEGNSNFEC